MRIKPMSKWFAAAAIGAVAVSAFAALETGVKAPDFSTKAALDGKEFTYSLSKQLHKGPVVV
jgi:hypothetical protein